MATNTKGFKISKTQQGQELSKYTGKATDIEIPDNVEIIGHNAFGNNTDIISVKIPSSVKKIGFNAFQKCTNLESVELTEGLEKIESWAFYGCSSLKEIIIPQSVKSIASKAFFGCEKLSKFVLNHEVQLEDSFIDVCNSLPAVDGFVMIQNYLVKYVGHESEVKVPDSIKVIGERSFYENKEIKTVTLPDSVVKICNDAFYNCSSLESIEIPSGVESIGHWVFYGCSKLSSVALPPGINAVASYMFEGCSALKSIEIPSNVTYIRSSAFAMCTGLEQVLLSENLEEIERSAFCRCSGLKEIKIPSGVVKIGEYAFEDCTGLEKIDLPKNIQELEKAAFENTKWQKDQKDDCILNHYLIDYKENLQTVEIPQEVESIAEGVFQGDYHIETVIIPPNVKRIMSYAFDSCYTLKTVELHHLADIKEHNFTGCGQLDASTFDEKTLMCFYLSTVKNKTANECRDLIIKKGLESMYASFEKLLEGCDNPAIYERFAKLLVSAKDKLNDEVKERIPSVFQNCSDNKVMKYLVKNDVIKGDAGAEATKKAIADSKAALLKKESKEDEIKLEKGLRPDEKVIEQFAEKYVQSNKIHEAANVVTKDVVYYKNSHISVKAEVLSVFLNEYIQQWKKNCRVESGINYHEELHNGERIKISESADYIYSFLDEESLEKFLLRLLRGANYRLYVLSYGRFAKSSLPDVIKMVKERAKGNSKDKYWANNVEQALLLNENLEAMKYLDSVRLLGTYAKMRGMEEQEIRDLRMLPDFGFDNDLKVHYSSGDYHVSARLLPDFRFELFDENNNKVIKTFPSKGIGEKELAQFKEEYSSLKKDVNTFVKEKTLNLSKIHISGESMKSDHWQKIYVDKRLLSYLTRGLIWADMSGNTFTINEKDVIDINGNPYKPDGRISLAHVCDLKSDEIGKWQQYLIQNSIKQPFDQIWEPVIHADKTTLEKYKGLHISSQERNQLKSNLKKKGIDVYSDELEREFDHRSYTYVFNNRNTMHLGKYLNINYIIQDDNSIIFDKFTIKESNRRYLNAVIFEIGKLAMVHNIKNDNAEELTDIILDTFTQSQIMNFVDIASKSKSTNCSAKLLAYKNSKYGETDYIDGLVLDLI